MSWNSGPFEGHVNRIKMLKRHMYGRRWGFESPASDLAPMLPDLRCGAWG